METNPFLGDELLARSAAEINKLNALAEKMNFILNKADAYTLSVRQFLIKEASRERSAYTHTSQPNRL